MKTFGLVLLTMGAGFALPAQTNPPVPAAEPPALTAPAAEAQTNAPARAVPPPAEVRLTEIKSDSGTFNLKSNVFVYQGNVRVDNPQMKLTCDLLTAEMPRMAVGKFNRVTAEQNVVIDWLDDKGQNNHATSARAVYTYSITNSVTNTVVELTGNPVLMNPQGTNAGDVIVWDRIRGTVYTKNPRTSILENGANTPGFFEGLNESKTNSAKPKAGEAAK
jgi:lipopolysaccharide transport protein LptA